MSVITVAAVPEFSTMSDARMTYDDVEVLEHDGSGFTCLVRGQRVFVGKYVPVPGTTVARRGDRGRLVVPRTFAEEQRLPIDEVPVGD